MHRVPAWRNKSLLCRVCVVEKHTHTHTAALHNRATQTWHNSDSVVETLFTSDSFTTCRYLQHCCLNTGKYTTTHTHAHTQSKCDDTNVKESVNRCADVQLTESHKLGLDFTIPDFSHQATRGSVLWHNLGRREELTWNRRKGIIRTEYNPD